MHCGLNACRTHPSACTVAPPTRKATVPWMGRFTSLRVSSTGRASTSSPSCTSPSARLRLAPATAAVRTPARDRRQANGSTASACCGSGHWRISLRLSGAKASAASTPTASARTLKRYLASSAHIVSSSPLPIIIAAACSNASTSRGARIVACAAKTAPTVGRRGASSAADTNAASCAAPRGASCSSDTHASLPHTSSMAWSTASGFPSYMYCSSGDTGQEVLSSEACASATRLASRLEGS
jgi:hypothetical protein